MKGSDLVPKNARFLMKEGYYWVNIFNKKEKYLLQQLIYFDELVTIQIPVKESCSYEYDKFMSCLIQSFQKQLDKKAHEKEIQDLIERVLSEPYLPYIPYSPLSIELSQDLKSLLGNPIDKIVDFETYKSKAIQSMPYSLFLVAIHSEEAFLQVINYIRHYKSKQVLRSENIVIKTKYREVSQICLENGIIFVHDPLSMGIDITFDFIVSTGTERSFFTYDRLMKDIEIIEAYSDQVNPPCSVEVTKRFVDGVLENKKRIDTLISTPLNKSAALK